MKRVDGPSSALLPGKTVDFEHGERFSRHRDDAAVPTTGSSLICSRCPAYSLRPFAFERDSRTFRGTESSAEPTR